MNHLIMSKPQCLLYSAAMALDLDVEDITTILGHDALPPNGVHIQEIQTIACRLGKHFYPVEVIPASLVGNPPTIHPLYEICGTEYSVRFMAMIHGTKGIMIGQNKKGNEHAVAYQDGVIFDPVGRKYPIGCFNVKEAWILCC